MELNDSNKIYSEMISFLNKRFEDNLRTFGILLPDIAKEFNSYTPQKKISFTCSSNGIPNLLIDNELFFKCEDPIDFCKQQVISLIQGKATHVKFHSKICNKGYFKDKFLTEIINHVEFEKNEFPNVQEARYVPTSIVFGIGLGYHIAELLERVEVLNLILIEPDKDLFYASLFTFDWKNLLTFFSENNLGLKIIVGDIENIPLQVSKYFRYHGKFLSSNVLFYVHYQTELINKTQNIIYQNLYDAIRANGFIDDTLYGISHAVHSILAKKSFVNKSPLNSHYVNSPVFIIGSGPSLDKDIEFIRHNQNKAIIIACGTALDILYHAGIQPDFYANTERVPEVRQSLDIIPDKDFFDRIILLSSDVCHPLTVSKFKKTALFGKGDEPFYKILIKKFRKFNNIQYITSMNPLVGNMGIAGALYLGFINLFLFGIDCGKVNKNIKIHSSYSTLYNEHGCYDAGSQFQTPYEVEGNFETTCQTNELYKLSIRKIEDVLRLFQRNQIKCVNCSNGCKIRYTQAIHSNELQNEFNKLIELDKNEFQKEFLAEKTTKIDLSLKDIDSLFDQKQIKETCQELISFIRQNRETKNDYIKMMQDISEHLSYLASTLEYFLNINVIINTLQQAFIVLTQALYLYTDEKIAIKKANLIKEVIIDYLTEVPEIYKNLPDYIMGEELKHYPNGMVGRDLPHTKAIQFNKTINIVPNNYIDPCQKFKKA